MSDARSDDAAGQAGLGGDQIARALGVLGLVTEVDLLADLRRDVGADERDGHVERPLEHLEQRAVAPKVAEKMSRAREFEGAHKTICFWIAGRWTLTAHVLPSSVALWTWAIEAL